jgi:hypothetical protein
MTRAAVALGLRLLADGLAHLLQLWHKLPEAEASLTNVPD